MVVLALSHKIINSKPIFIGNTYQNLLLTIRIQPHLTNPHKPNLQSLTNLTNINKTHYKHKLTQKSHTPNLKGGLIHPIPLLYENKQTFKLLF